MKIANNKPPIVDDACPVHEKKTYPWAYQVYYITTLCLKHPQTIMIDHPLPHGSD